ncbi:helix-turn-helix domain-containing protein [Pusillimonas sp. ANT_WB101]|uniref:helix-turn-helix domain-containing protein n=1 Tax=Pusillimonas sp. ANT_WB101 TaxID=2597356 RepID=UPI0011ECF0E1|nr:helix-turn-helix domain-containing protein [Pusillimonas sp. ANT_WB101]KAA0911357.1 helix-turn-helix domain-containing protein [Pusillimonas sp. ANT_WB101]
MTSKPISSSSRKKQATPAHGRALSVRDAFVRSTLAVKLSFDVEPFVSIIQRHVKLSKKAREAITHDLAEVLGHADVQLMTAADDAAGQRLAPVSEADPVLTTEEAARMVGVSRPFIAKLIDSGEIELHQKVGNQRRVLSSAVTRWQVTERDRQAHSLKRLSEDLDKEIFSL